MSEAASRAGWTRVSFGDVVRLRRERSSHPEEDGFERYVGLDHLEPGDLKIRRWGDVGDGTTFTSVFHSGQVLFGKRRAYQRKVAVADFDGVCSGDIYVLEPSSPALLSDLLPFICQTDGFFEHAVGTSAGSLSPRTNWTSLATYEFALPPLEEQRRMASALTAVISASQALLMAARTSQQAFSSLLSHRLHIAHAAAVPLGDIATVERGKFSHRPRNLPEFYGGDADFVQTGDVASSRGVLGSASQTLSELGKQYGKSFPPGTVLVTIAAVIGATALTTREVWCPDSVVGILANRGVVDPTYLEFAMRWLRPALEEREATSSTQKNINLAILRPLRIPMMPMQEQLRVVDELSRLERSGAALEQRHAALLRMCQSILAGRSRAT